MIGIFRIFVSALVFVWIEDLRFSVWPISGLLAFRRAVDDNAE